MIDRRTFNTEMVSTSNLSPNPWNPNEMTDFMFEREKESIRKFGFLDPITVRETAEGLQIVDGEHRWKAAKELGSLELPIINLGSITKAKAQALTEALNNLRGEHNPEKEAIMLSELLTAEPDLRSILPYEESDLASILANLEEPDISSMGEAVLSSDEWYTPMEYIEAVRDLYGGTIDLDPASNDEAQKIVQATTYYTKEDDGLNQDWDGKKVFLNPPFSQPLIQMFIHKAIETYDDSPSTQIVVIVNNATDTEWFHELLSNGPCCLTRGRIQFWRPGEHSTANRQGQAIFYLGAHPHAFTRIFSTFGTVITLS